MLPAILGDAKFWRLLVRFDEDLAAEVRAARCPQCAAPLHSARYPRKPRGVARGLLGEDYEHRLSFCCAPEGCRRRATPASVRFLGRRVYLGALVVLISALAQGLTGARQRQLCERLGLSQRTLRRWRRWWREVFPASRWWQGGHGQLVPAVEAAQLPGALLERFRHTDPATHLLEVLAFLAPCASAIAAEQAR
jgi:hypothetical protein